MAPRKSAAPKKKKNASPASRVKKVAKKASRVARTATKRAAQAGSVLERLGELIEGGAAVAEGALNSVTSRAGRKKTAKKPAKKRAG